MKQFLAILFIGLFMVSCGTKKRMAQREAERQKKEVIIVPETKEETITEEVNEIPAPVTVIPNSTEAYIDMYSAIAQQEMKLYGIPASITLAQGILESGSGKGRLSVEANNHFGIKCHEWTGARIYHDDDESQECFRKYKDAKYSFRDHSLFLTERRRYSGLFDLRKDDYKAWAKGLRAAGYATDKRYPEKLIGLIERYELHKFDEFENAQIIIEEQIIENTEAEYIVVKGDTLYSISKRFNLTVQELQQLNGLDTTEIKIGQVLSVKPSPKDF